MGKKTFDSSGGYKEFQEKRRQIIPTETPDEKETNSQSITIRIKPSEYKIFKEKIGKHVPPATYIVHYLREETDLFN